MTETVVRANGRLVATAQAQVGLLTAHDHARDVRRDSDPRGARPRTRRRTRRPRVPLHQGHSTLSRSRSGPAPRCAPEHRRRRHAARLSPYRGDPGSARDLARERDGPSSGAPTRPPRYPHPWSRRYAATAPECSGTGVVWIINPGVRYCRPRTKSGSSRAASSTRTSTTVRATPGASPGRARR